MKVLLVRTERIHIMANKVCCVIARLDLDGFVSKELLELEWLHRVLLNITVAHIPPDG